MPALAAFDVRAVHCALATLALLLNATTARAQDADELARQLANPVADLISVPLQVNFDDGLGAGGERWTLNIQPVIPISLNDDWNLISRTILPLISQRNVIGRSEQDGFGDALQSLFLSPKAAGPGGWIWGAGPALLLPTGDDAFTADQWGAGPTAVVLKQTPDGWTYGALANHLWGVDNSGAAPDVDATFVQPFVSRSLGAGATAVLNVESTYDWNSSAWTIPLNVSFSKVMQVGQQLVSLGGGARVYLEGAQGTPDWGLRFTLTLLYAQ